MQQTTVITKQKDVDQAVPIICSPLIHDQENKLQELLILTCKKNVTQNL